MAKKYIEVATSGALTEIEGTVTSAGVGDAGEIVALDATGKLDASVLPSGVGADQKAYEFTEAAAAGDLLNIFDDGGTAKVRLADATNGRQAHAFAPAAVLLAATGNAQFEGEVPNQTGLTVGGSMLLGAAGAITETVNTTATQLHQVIGVARDATTVDFEPQNPVTRA